MAFWPSQRGSAVHGQAVGSQAATSVYPLTLDQPLDAALACNGSQGHQSIGDASVPPTPVNRG